MAKASTKQVILTEFDYNTSPRDIYDILEDLYLIHHSTPKAVLKTKLPYASGYFLISNKVGTVIGMSSYQKVSKRLVMTERTILYPKYRGLGYGTATSKELERVLKAKGFGKICCQVYTFNHYMVLLKMKQGYFIEGLLRDHEDVGLHEYYLGKEI